jgi:hypothetical protein
MFDELLDGAVRADRVVVVVAALTHSAIEHTRH